VVEGVDGGMVADGHRESVVLARRLEEERAFFTMITIMWEELGSLLDELFEGDRRWDVREWD
jgi:hypothetical protein